MDRQLAFVLSVMAYALGEDAKLGRSLAGAIVGQASRVVIPDDGNVEDYALEYVAYEYNPYDDAVRRPEWLKDSGAG